MRLTIEEIADAVRGRMAVEPRSRQSVIDSLTWDSREVTAGCAYVALPGERVDGNDFVASALDAGAQCALVTREPDACAREAAERSGAAIVEVGDARQSLVDLARAWRARLGGRVIGLTGSSGKTTTKNLVRDVLGAAMAVTATARNQNNELGVPKTLLSAAADDDAVVVEMGMRGLRQIEQLCDFVRPDWGLVVNVGTSHMELLGSRENIARAKAELLEALPEGGRAFLNAADDYAPFMRELARLDARGVAVAAFDGSPDASARMRAVASGEEVPGCVARPGDALAWAEGIELDEDGCARFTLCAAGFPGQAPGVESSVCRLALAGLHNVGNACAATAVGRASGMALEAIARALADARPESGRAQVLHSPSGCLVIDDSYNANPDSMRASLRTFGAMRVLGRKIAVLGDMGELGPFSREGHRQVGADAVAAGVDELVCVGPLAEGIADAAAEAGLSADRIVRVADAASALEAARGLERSGDAVLVKASHSVGLERVVEGLVG